MPRINLLPHREQERKRRRTEFAVALIAAAIAAAVVVGGGKVLYSTWTDAQNEKNNLLKKEIVKLDAQIADIQDLENRKQRLVARMEIIEKLQRQRPEIVHRFDELVRIVPEGVYLTQIKEIGKKMSHNKALTRCGAAEGIARDGGLPARADGSRQIGRCLK